MKLRSYKLIKREEQKDAISFIAKLPRNKKRVIILCLPAIKVAGVAYVKKMVKIMEAVKAEKGIIVAYSLFGGEASYLFNNDFWPVMILKE